MRRTKDDDGLMPQQARFCRLIAEGRSQHDAFVEAFPKSRAKGESIDTMASRLLARVEIKSRIRELLRASKATDMDSQGEVYKDLCTAILKAEQAGNWTAYASLMRLRMQHMGMLKDHLVMSDLSVSDETLLQKLAGDDKALRAQLERLLGSETFEKPTVEPSPTIAPMSKMKH